MLKAEDRDSGDWSRTTTTMERSLFTSAKKDDQSHGETKTKYCFILFKKEKTLNGTHFIYL